MVEPKYALQVKRGQPAQLMTATLPSPDTDWVILACGESNQRWEAWKRYYDITVDDIKWVPLNSVFSTTEEAQSAVKEFILSKQAVWLDTKGEVVR